MQMNEDNQIFTAPASELKPGTPEANAAVSDKEPVATLIPVTAPMTRLASFIAETYRVNSDHRRASGVEDKLVYALRACKTRHDPATEARLSSAGIPRDLFCPITDTKRRAAMAQLLDIFNAPGDKPWTLSPTPVPEVPLSVMQGAFMKIMQDIVQIAQATGEPPDPSFMTQQAAARIDEVWNSNEEWAKRRCERMEKKVHDQLVEGGWIDAFSQYVNYICTYGTGIIEGPVDKVVSTCRMKEGRLGNLVYSLEYKTIPTYSAVSPWDCYPAPGARKIGDGPVCIRVHYTADSLWRYAESQEGKKNGNDGWMPETVRALLSVHPRGGVKIIEEANDSVRRELESDGADSGRDCTMEGVKCYASVRGSDIRDFGILMDRQGKTIDPFRYYQIEAVTIDGYVVFCRILDPRIGIPLAKGVFYECPDSWWGDSVAEKLKTDQRIMNTALANLERNIAMASGPMFWFNDISRIVDKDGKGLTLYPFKTFVFNMGLMGSTGAPMGSISVDSRMQELWSTFEAAKNQADDDSGIPAYTYGQNANSGGALRTASGVAMLTEAANRGMKMVISATDKDVIRDRIKAQVKYNLIYLDDESIKGDCEVNPAGVMGQILKEQESQRRQQFLSIAIANPTVQQIVGVKGVCELMRPEIKALGINPDDVLPSKEKQAMLQALQEIKQMNEVAQSSQDAQPEQVQEGQPSQGQAPAKSPMLGSNTMTRQQRVTGGIQANPQQAALRRGLPQAGNDNAGKVAQRGGAA